MEFTIKQRTRNTGIDRVCVKKRQWTIIFSMVMIFQFAWALPSKKTAVFTACKLVEIQKIVRGKVTDEKGIPIPGANVYFKGTKNGVRTDAEGNFSIEVFGDKSILVISFVGMESREVVVENQNFPLNIVLVKTEERLSDVVVVGYNSLKSQSVVGSLQTIVNKKITNATTHSVENLLEGKIANVYISPGSGQPGSPGIILIRGKASVNGSTDPLWVVDGVTIGGGGGAFDTNSTDGVKINPVDIETMTILKDAASTAMYGSQGANGVIIVTTKNGKSGKANINFSTKMAGTTLDMGNFSLMNGAQLYDLYNSFPNKQEFSANWWWKPQLRNRNFDWWNNATRTGLATDYNLSISGGSENFKSYISLGAYNETGAIRGYDYARYNALLKFSYKVNKWLTIKPQMNATRTKQLNKQHSLESMLANLPWDYPYLENGTLVGNQPNPTWVNSESSNYLYDLQWDFNESDAYGLRGNFDFDIKFSNSFSFSSINNHSFSASNALTYSDPRSSSGIDVKGRMDDMMNSYNATYLNQLIKFNKSFQNHDVNAVIGYEWNESNAKFTDAIATQFPPGYVVSNAAALAEKVKGNRMDWAVQSLLSNINYSYNNKYLAQLSFRRDGASNFGTNSRYGNFYSLGVGWNIHNENFFKAEYITNLKLRASYGSVGNRPTSLYPYMGLYSLNASYNENVGAILSQFPNPDLSWEKTFTTGVGLDISFYKLFNLTLDYYDKNTSNMLYMVPLPGVMGIPRVWRNIGSLNNRGLEATINVDMVKNATWQWSIDANIAFNKNEIIGLYGQKQIISGYNLLAEGKDINTWYMPEWAGVDPQTGQPQWLATNEKGERVKTFKYSDAAKTPISTGTSSPTFFGGFSSTVNYKNFDFSAGFTYSVGGTIYNYARTFLDADGATTTGNQINLINGWNRWQKPGDIATHPQAIYNNPSQSNKTSSRYLETATFLKLNSITLGYNLTSKRLNISNLRVFIGGENLFRISHFSGIPTGGNFSGVSANEYPLTRKIIVGLNLNL